jgi:hypothetical protein
MKAARRTSARAACAAASALVAALALVVPAAGAAERRVPPRFVGVMWDKDIQDAPREVQTPEWERMARSGVETARVIFAWNLSQEEPQHKPNFVRADAMVEDAARHGIDLLPVVSYAPPWARIEPEHLGSAPRDVDAYIRYVAELVHRYGPRGYYWRRNPDVPKRPIRQWQVWNEPSQEYQFSPHEGWQRRYARMLKRAYRAIKRRDPGATVVLAGLANQAWASLGELHRAARVGPYYDVAALHMYSARPADFVEIVRRFRLALDRNGGRRKPIYVTEAGASASLDDFRSPGHEHFQTTDRQMARLIAPSYAALAGVRRRYGVERVYWYTWASEYTRLSGVFGYAGLNQFDGFSVTPRPALTAYRRMAAAYEGCRKDARARCVR